MKTYEIQFGKILGGQFVNDEIDEVYNSYEEAKERFDSAKALLESGRTIILWETENEIGRSIEEYTEEETEEEA